MRRACARRGWGGGGGGARRGWRGVRDAAGSATSDSSAASQPMQTARSAGRKTDSDREAVLPQFILGVRADRARARGDGWVSTCAWDFGVSRGSHGGGGGAAGQRAVEVRAGAFAHRLSARRRLRWADVRQGAAKNVARSARPSRSHATAFLVARGPTNGTRQISNFVQGLSSLAAELSEEADNELVCHSVFSISLQWGHSGRSRQWIGGHHPSRRLQEVQVRAQAAFAASSRLGGTAVAAHGDAAHGGRARRALPQRACAAPPAALVNARFRDDCRRRRGAPAPPPPGRGAGPCAPSPRRSSAPGWTRRWSPEPTPERRSPGTRLRLSLRLRLSACAARGRR